MYDRDVPRIREWALEKPDNLASVITFTLLTIRQPFRSVSAAMRDVRRNGRASVYLWGWKQPGYDYVQEHKAEIFAELADTTTPYAIDYLAVNVPGLGIVKSAFVAQMLGHSVACMDSRNLKTLGYDERSFREFERRDGRCVVSAETRYRRIAAYIQMTLETGGAEHWWNHWCTGIAPTMDRTPEEVSALHWTIPTGKYK